MLVNAKEMLDKAYENGYGIGQFNINNLEWTKAILEACQEKKSAVILGVSEGAAKYMGGFNVVSKMVEGLDKDLNITVPVALHLDHGSYEGAKKALDAGFTSIMFDGSSLPIDENIEKTKEIVELCHSKNVSVEAEVGGIGGEEDGVVSAGELADPEECKKVASLGIDFLAAGIGNIHGVYPEDWQGLNFKRLEEIKEAAGKIPLVLHGGTGIPEEQVKKAIERGVSKININTECQIVFTEATRKYFEEGKDKVGKGFDPRKVLKPGFEAIKDKVREKIEFFECENSAEK
ncbi:MAG: class II fructose-1,6-bisphosphate aldolase [Anaerococcus vaginalis]|uniref:class II fructose-1,6-bisphosphate aldolase n=1 Tax=Anaerococcus TaxID=165779 RepID=UPI0008A412DA|nr:MULTISPECIES: class II fructose-1,6-bisphosphate aldolase [Anaerococcus]MDU1763896.1 class II fructose-1,6-bisphosphate aldolase [Anaerococcus vaginalis]MDU5342395.1 class II fructose-1,6-bisphosphate aldolase [Anaerococcus vaginalis]OFL16786.1 fructose-bisphosphate aldolase [Anaerococcus sp. HMSC068A02]